MKAQSGRRGTPELTLLQNMVWANSVIAANNGSTSKLVFLFPQTSGGSDSTMFHKIRDHGRPTPALFHHDGLPGPALLAEKEYPGTLKWLLHPLWTVLTTAENPMLGLVYRTMASLQIEGCEPLVSFEKGEVIRSKVQINEQLELLKLCGSLDALTALILLAQEAFCICRPRSHKAVLEFSRTAIPEWPCLSWMPFELRVAVMKCILHKIYCCEPAPLDSSVAYFETFQISILNLEAAGSEFVFLDIDIAKNYYENSIMKKDFQNSPTFDLSDAARSTLLDRIVPWLKMGTP